MIEPTHQTRHETGFTLQTVELYGNRSCRSWAAYSRHPKARRCGYPADSSDLAAGAVGTATSIPSPSHPSGAGRSAACGSRPARFWPVTRVAHAWRASATNTHSLSVTYRRTAARPAQAPPRCGAEPPTVSARAQANCVRLPPVYESLSLRRGAGLLPTVSAQANCDGPSTLPDRASLTRRRAAGPGPLC